MTADEKIRTEMTWERFLYEHSHPMAERLLREYQEKHIPVKQAAQDDCKNGCKIDKSLKKFTESNKDD